MQHHNLSIGDFLAKDKKTIHLKLRKVIEVDSAASGGKQSSKRYYQGGSSESFQKSSQYLYFQKPNPTDHRFYSFALFEGNTKNAFVRWNIKMQLYVLVYAVGFACCHWVFCL